MNHQQIEEKQVVDRYLMGRLTAEEAAAFEEHYLSCASCLERLELAEGFQTGIKRVAGEEAAKAVAKRLGVIAWVARAARSPHGGLLTAAALAALILPSALLYRELGSERERAGALAAELATERTPQANPLVVALSLERGSPGDVPSTRIRLPATPGWIVLSLKLDRPELTTYRVTLLGPGGNELWRGNGLTPNHLGALGVGIPSRFLTAGDHELRAEGVAGDGGSVPVGRFGFRVVAAAK